MEFGKATANIQLARPRHPSSSKCRWAIASCHRTHLPVVSSIFSWADEPAIRDSTVLEARRARSPSFRCAEIECAGRHEGGVRRKPPSKLRSRLRCRSDGAARQLYLVMLATERCKPCVHVKGRASPSPPAQPDIGASPMAVTGAMFLVAWKAIAHWQVQSPLPQCFDFFQHED
jgi:hypothetical protein